MQARRDPGDPEQLNDSGLTGLYVSRPVGPWQKERGQEERTVDPERLHR